MNGHTFPVLIPQSWKFGRRIPVKARKTMAFTLPLTAVVVYLIPEPLLPHLICKEPDVKGMRKSGTLLHWLLTFLATIGVPETGILTTRYLFSLLPRVLKTLCGSVWIGDRKYHDWWLPCYHPCLWYTELQARRLKCLADPLCEFSLQPSSGMDIKWILRRVLFAVSPLPFLRILSTAAWMNHVDLFASSVGHFDVEAEGGFSSYIDLHLLRLLQSQ